MTEAIEVCESRQTHQKESDHSNIEDVKTGKQRKQRFDKEEIHRAAMKLNRELAVVASSDIIEADDELRNNMKLSAKEKFINKYHPYEITQLRGNYSAGYWQTRLPDGKKLKKADRTELIHALYAFYSQEGLTISDIFGEWLEWKCDRRNNKADTKKQHQRHFNKYVAGTKLSKIPLIKMTFEDCEDWAIETLKKFPMTAHRFNTAKIVVTGPLSYAVRTHKISKTPWVKEAIDYSRLLRSERIRPADEVTFSKEELQALMDALLRDYNKYHNSVNLGLIINFDLGLRTGELAALKWSDIRGPEGKRSVFIHRQDIGYDVEDAVKADAKAGYRELPISETGEALFDILKQDQAVPSEWVFTDQKGNRRKKHAFMDKLRELQRREFGLVKTKSNKNIRMTVCSELGDDLGLAEAQRWLGHNQLSTTEKYYLKSRKNDENRREYLRRTQLHPDMTLLKAQ